MEGQIINQKKAEILTDGFESYWFFFQKAKDDKSPTWLQKSSIEERQKV